MPVYISGSESDQGEATHAERARQTSFGQCTSALTQQQLQICSLPTVWLEEHPAADRANSRSWPLRWSQNAVSLASLVRFRETAPHAPAMVLKAGFFLSVGTAFGMYLAQEYDGMPNVKAFTTGLVSEASGWLQAICFCYLQATKVAVGHCSLRKQRALKRTYARTRTDMTEKLWHSTCRLKTQSLQLLLHNTCQLKPGHSLDAWQQQRHIWSSI